MGLQIEDQGYLCAVQLVVIINSVIKNNVLLTSWYGGEAVRLCTVPYSVQVYDAQTKRIIQTEFWNTKFKKHVISDSDHFAVVKIKSNAIVTFSSCTFLDNKLAAICVFQTNVIFRGNNAFPNNSDASGAGLALFMNSYMHLKLSSNLLLVNSQALSVGGAVYTDLALELLNSSMLLPGTH